MRWYDAISAAKHRHVFGGLHSLPRASTLVASLALLMTPTAWAAPGDLDPSFGPGGHTSVQVNKACLRGCVEFGGSYGDALALQPDGGIVLGGYNNYFGAGSDAEKAPGALVRLRPDGTLDTSFGGSGGIVDTPFKVDAIAANARGGLRVAGEVGRKTGVQRYTSSGVLDGFYGDHGVRWLARSVEGRRDAAGRTLQLVTVVVPATDYDPQTTRLDVTRFLPSGKRDTRFGRRGYAALPNSTGATPGGVAPQRDGSMIVTFTSENHAAFPKDTSRVFLERLTSGGKLDRSFGKRGIVRTSLTGSVNNATIFPVSDGHFLLIGAERRGAGVLGGDRYLAVASYTRNGHLDRRFGRGGIARSEVATGDRYLGVSATALTFDFSGDMIVVGRLGIRTVDTPAGDGFVARYTPRGRDCSFGVGGIVVDTRFGAANAVAVQPDGRIVVAGWGGGFAAARYMGGGRPRTCPGEG
jgi:uncharacterized delta-60 repeat protein